MRNIFNLAASQSLLMNRRLILISSISAAILGATAFVYWYCKPPPAPLIAESDLASHIGTRISIRGTLLLRFKLSPLVEVGRETILLSDDPIGFLDGQSAIVTGILGQRTFPDPGVGKEESAGPAAGVMFTMQGESLRLTERGPN